MSEVLSSSNFITAWTARMQSAADQHPTATHGFAPTLLRCDLVLRAKRRRMVAAGVPEEDLPVIMPGLKAVSDCGQEAQG